MKRAFFKIGDMIEVKSFTKEEFFSLILDVEKWRTDEEWSVPFKTKGENGTTKNAFIQLKKKDVVWPIIVIATDVERCDDSFAEIFDSSAYNEIAHQYKDTIKSCCEGCEILLKSSVRTTFIEKIHS